MDVDVKAIREWAEEYFDYNAFKLDVQNAFSGWKLQDSAIVFNKSREVMAVMEKAIDIIEKFSNDISSLSGKEKLEACVKFLDDCIDVPFYLEWFDEIAIRLLISQIVDLKNKYFATPEILE